MIRRVIAGVLVSAGAGAWIQNCAWNYDGLGLWVFALPAVPFLIAIWLLAKR